MKGTYESSKKGNFEVVDDIGVPHHYCIGTRHVAHAADNYNGMLGDSSIRDGEKEGIVCEACKGKLSYDEHKQALLVKCSDDFEDKTNEDLRNELQEYLVDIKEEAEKSGYSGFAFIFNKDYTRR